MAQKEAALREGQDSRPRGEGRMSGRELFENDAAAFVDDEGAADAYEREASDDEQEADGAKAPVTPRCCRFMSFPP